MSSASLQDSGSTIEHMTGIVLGGGGSRRMGGRAKALLRVGDKTIIERVVSVLRSVFKDVLLISDAKKEYRFLGIPVYADLRPGIGALGGLYTGLMQCPTDYAFVVACDMPFLNAAAVRRLAEPAPGHDVVVPRIGPHLEPLHAVYARACIPHVRALIDAGGLRIFDFFAQVDTLEVHESLFEDISPDLRFLMNVNTPEDLQYARDLAESDSIR
jgi:molybdopterin-guanine dinucleotide biosynthesis protein A